MSRGNRDAILRIIEVQPEVSNRFTNLARIGGSGGDGYFSIVVSALDRTTGKELPSSFSIRRMSPTFTGDPAFNARPIC